MLIELELGGKLMKINYDFLESGEQVIMEGSANKTIFIGWNKGGKLILTNNRLVFIAHGFNLGKKFEEIPFSQVAFSGNTLSLLVPSPSMIKVVTRDGKTHKFVVRGKQKEEWKQKISEVVQKYKESK
jgi:hypothetical protein